MTDKILDNSLNRHGKLAPLFLSAGAAATTTLERLRGFRDAHEARGMSVPEENILLSPGCSKGKVEACMQARFKSADEHLQVLRYRPSRWKGGEMAGAVGLTGVEQPPMGYLAGTFDWDPFIYWVTILTWCSRTSRRWKRYSISSTQVKPASSEIPPLLISSREHLA